MRSERGEVRALDGCPLDVNVTGMMTEAGMGKQGLSWKLKKEEETWFESPSWGALMEMKAVWNA